MSEKQNQSRVEKLRGRENYDEWRISAKSYLIIKGLWGAVTGELPPESSPETNAKAISEITLMLDASLFSYIKETESAKEVWDTIAKAFDDSGIPRKVTILNQLVSIRLIRFQSMERYINEILLYWNKSKIAGFKIDEDIIASLMLGGLPEEYQALILGIENSAKELTVDYVKTVLLQGIKDPFHKGEENGRAFAVKTVSKGFKNKQRKCFTCGSGNHISPSCPKKKEKAKCYNCGETSHFARNCKKPKKSEEPEKGKKVEVTKERMFIALLSKETNESISTNWYIDSGASTHMTNSLATLMNIKMIEEREVIVANNERLKVDMKGDAVFEIDDGEQIIKCTVKNVLFVPGICANLISVNQLTQQGFSVMFEEDKCKILDENEVVLEAHRSEGMYKLQTESVEWACVAKQVSGKTWHRRLCHIGKDKMQFLKEKYNIKLPDCKCIVCLKGKQTRKEFKESNSRKGSPLELIHTDVVGPMQDESISGYKYFITFIDDYSNKLFTYPMWRKSEAFEKFSEFIKLAEKQTGKELKAIRSDNGLEYINKQFESFCAENGVKHQKTAPYSPQQNGKAERMNRTLLDRIRCMLIDSELDNSFWAEAMNTATYTLNMIPLDNGKSPNELWNNEEGDIESLKVFGCKALVHVPDQKRRKLDDKSQECIFLGYEPNTKAYRLYNIRNDLIVISRDVDFMEEERIEENNLMLINDNSEVGGEDIICPSTYEEAIKDKNAEKWINAMKNEYNSLIENKTWEIKDPPEERKLIKNKWIFTVKRDEKGKILKYKARLVAKGFSQKDGIDYDETFSPVVRYGSIRLLLAIAAGYNLNIRQLDAVTAFLNGKLEEDIWMEQPKGFEDGEKGACKLIKAIYGLKQASRVWNNTINSVLINIGLSKSIMDQCIYYKQEEENMTFVAVYVDDILIFSNSKEYEEEIVKELSSSFKMKDMGEAKNILGFKISRKREYGQIALSQQRYIDDILKRYGMNESKPVSTPLDMNQKISGEMSPEDEEEIAEMKKVPYREAIGSLLYAAQITRPDIGFAVNLLSRYCENPGRGHWIGVKRIMRYLKGTRGYELIYGEAEEKITGYCDADWASDVDKRKSTTGYVFTMYGGAISWGTRRQPTVALSTTEAEYMSMVAAIQEAMWLKQLLEEIFNIVAKPIKIYNDNIGAIELAKNNGYSARSKHIDIKNKFIHEKLNERVIELEYLQTDQMPADILTKAVTKSCMLKHLPEFGINYGIEE